MSLSTIVVALNAQLLRRVTLTRGVSCEAMEQSRSARSETLDLSVPTVHCRSCKLNIEDALEELEGVIGSEVDLDARRVTVAFEPAVVGASKISAAIEAAGYAVEAT